MSLSSDLKLQLARKKPEKECCKKAQCYAMLLFSGLVSSSGAKYITHHRCSAQMLAQSVASQFGVLAEIREYGANDEKNKRYEVVLPSEEERIAMYTLLFNESGAVSSGLMPEHCCRRAFLCGAFLVCGTISDPQKSYNLEFDVPNKTCARFLGALLKKLKISAGISERKNSYVVYVRGLESLQEAVAQLGAGDMCIDLMRISLKKSAMNYANRTANCDRANIAKQINAAVIQREAIIKLGGKDGIDKLPVELREIALLRFENPDMSLREIAEALHEPVSRSAVSRRLNKLIELAEEIKSK